MSSAIINDLELKNEIISCHFEHWPTPLIATIWHKMMCFQYKTPK